MSILLILGSDEISSHAGARLILGLHAALGERARYSSVFDLLQNRKMEGRPSDPAFDQGASASY